MKNKKKITTLVLGIGIALIVIGITYAFINVQLTGTKKVTITAGTLDLILDEDENNLNIENAFPMYDEVGMIQEPFTFRLKNNAEIVTNYILKLTNITTGDQLDTSIVKYNLTKNGVGEPALLSTLPEDGAIDSGTIGNKETIEYTLRLWINSDVTDNEALSGKSLSYRVDVDTSIGEQNSKQTVTFAGITKEVNETVDAMFNYTSEGKYISDYDAWEKSTDTNYVTNGIYTMEDDDGPSYFYRGEVNNLVKFGSYTKDYYIYRYTEGTYTHDFPSLEACQYYRSSCSESNKVLKYAASDNIPMYWRIVRVNGDGTIRMIYAGTTPDATGLDAGIGESRYNEYNDVPKYTGYTYDRTTTEVDSHVKTVIDNWYSNVFEATVYDDKIATGKFCNDSSGYGEVLTDAYGDVYDGFSISKRLSPSYYNSEGNASPTFKCATTTETYGGSYNLKAGLITSDEIVAAGGGKEIANNSYYLYNGTSGEAFWTMSPDSDYYHLASVSFGGSFGDLFYLQVDGPLLLRPVINLKTDITFKSGTDGSISAPYEIN